ncbi:MAG: xanthine dehydrogenase family protein molybdopterin-binding subunit, partial [Planctomycetales bacterium]|nr:xanthine dehydrogenase family protein molybdopterin-binding subunit [Planctomycetales bacterium]
MSPRRDRRKLSVGLPNAVREIEADVPEGEPAPWGPDSKLKEVGGRVPRVEGAEKVSGSARYTSDVRLPGMLYGKVLRSPHPHARVRRVDLGPAKALPGVKAALALAEGREVRYQGDEIAALAAVTEEAAEDALHAIRVEYEVLPFVTDLEAARAPDAPEAAEGPNVRPGRPNGRGNVEEALAAADARIEATYRTPVQTHVPLETHGTVAQWEGEKLTVWDSTQAVHRVRDSLAQRLRKDKNSVRAISEHVGGGFGSKLGLGASAVIAAMLSREAGAPVKLLLSRREEHLASGNRPSSVQVIRAGARKDGTLVALALASHGTGGVRAGAAGCSAPLEQIYPCPNIRVEHADVVTNSGPACAMRAPGFVQGAFALESAVDELARELGMDPLEFRRKNLRTDSALDEIRAREYEIGAERIGWSRRGKDGAGKGVLRRGLGMANGIWGGAGGPGPVVEVTVAKDGTADVAVGTQDIGTGTRTACAMVAAEELGLPLAAVRVRIGDSDLPFATGSGGSSTAPSVTPAVRVAAAQARAALLEAAAKILEAPLGSLEVSGGRVVVKGTDKSVGLFEAAGR